MHSRLFLRTLLPVLGLVIALAPVSYATPPNRIASVSVESRAPLPHTVSPRVKSSTDLGSESAGRMLEDMTLRFSMTAAQQAALTQLLIDQQNPSSPRFHQWLTPEQFGAEFGLSTADIAKVTSWLTSQGFTVTAVARSSTFITFKGTVSQAQNAFSTNIHSLNLNGEQHFANTSDVALPPSIAGVVSTVTGLNDFKLKARARLRTVSPTSTVNANAVQPQYTSSVSGGHYIAPGDFYTIYDVNPLLTSGINGAGVGRCSSKPAGTVCGDIAIMGQVDLSLPDVAAFQKASGLSSNPPKVTLAGTTDPGAPASATSTPSTSDLSEAQLDVEWSGAVAPAAIILYVNSTDVIGISLPTAIDQRYAPIISISYGGCENNSSVSALNSYNQLFQQANAQGITIVGPTGDSGATDCDYQTTIATHGFAVDFPGSSPFVTAMGGTMFNEGTATGATSYWSATNGTTSGSAITYIPETVWNESNSSGLGSGGGGASAYFAKPSWQVTGLASDYARDIPDVSLNAASGHDGYLFCVRGSCTNGFRNAAGNLTVVGGTSVAAPSFAGILALVQQKTSSQMGNANPTIYALANGPNYNNIFRDITSGNNDSPCLVGTPNCPNGGSIGYTAGPGYDLATGWGTISAANLANNWSSATPIVDTNAKRFISATSLTTSAPICGITGGSLALSVTVSNGTVDSRGNPIVGPTPTGTVQFLVDNVAVGSPILLSGGIASYSLNTSALSSGGHTITAVYLSDGTHYANSRGTLLASDGSLTQIDVISSTSPDFSITPCTASTAVKSGGTAQGIVFNFTPVKGFTGTINLSISANQSVAAGYAFTPVSTPVDTVSITSAAGVPVTLTLSAFTTSAKSTTALRQLASNRQPVTKLPWYITGSGATLGCLFLLVLPRRRRWGALLALILSVGIVGAAIGCGSGSSSTPTPGNPSTPVTTPATPGTYAITVDAVASTSTGNLVHHATVLFTVQ